MATAAPAQPIRESEIAAAGPVTAATDAAAVAASPRGEWAAVYGPAALLVLAARVVHTLWQLRGGAPVFPVDDAYITLHNAQVLHWGRDPNYAGTPALAGATSPVHLALVAALMYVLPPLWALDASLWIGVLLYALGLVRLARVHGFPAPAAFLFALAGLLVALTPHQLLNGLETGLALASVAWALGFAQEPGRAGRWALPALCGLMPLLRPELIVLSVLLLALHAYRLRRAGWRAILGALGIAALCAIPWVLWVWASTGSPTPATVGAKRAWFAEAHLPFALKRYWVQSQLDLFAHHFGLVSLGALFLVRTWTGRLSLIFVVAFLLSYFTYLPGALSHYENRYLYVFAPILLFGIASAVPLLPRDRRQRCARLAAAVLAFQGLLFAPFWWGEHLRHRAITTHELAGVAEWCRGNLPPQSTLLIHDAGYIAYATHFRLADLVGLKTPWVTPYHRALTFPTQGRARGEAVSRIARASEAQYLVVLDDWDGIFHITSGLKTRGWRVQPMRLAGRYHVYRLSPPASPAPRTGATGAPN